MKKISKIFLINIILITIAYFTADLICFAKIVYNQKRTYVFNTPKLFIWYYLNTYKRFFYTKKEYDKLFIEGDKYYYFQFRTPENTDSPLKPILLMGCSFAYGSELEQNQSFMHKLAEITRRPIYNRAIAARGANEMLYQAQSEEFYSIVPEPEWLIYVFIPDQIRRTVIPCSIIDYGVFYDKNLKRKREINFPIIYAIKQQSINFYTPQYIDFYISVLTQIKKETQKHWKDTKYFILYYWDEEYINVWNYMKPKLEAEDFITATMQDLANDNLMSGEYTLSDNIHPSEKAWEIITPEIIRELEI